ncbi:hypothetical protein ABZ369_06500 [Streptomyces sp. NPDC005918]|uniref:hypothetical protein n=1 Tax=Streptomyces sp. NPDC005918 TaxID=3155454 RepID=UPI0034058ADC
METADLRKHEQEVYEVLLMHTVECATCRAEEDCTEAAQIRRALRVTRFVLRHAEDGTE